MLNVFVPSGSSQSSQFIAERSAALPLVLFVPSLSANAHALQFATTSGGSFVSLYTRTSGLSSVFSGTGGACVVIDYPPSPYCRLSFASALTDGASFAVGVTRRLE